MSALCHYVLCRVNIIFNIVKCTVVYHLLCGAWHWKGRSYRSARLLGLQNSLQCSLCAMFIVCNVHCVKSSLCAVFIVCSEVRAAKYLNHRLTLPVQLMHEISAGQGSVL